VAQQLRAAGSVAGLASPRATVESLGVFKPLLSDVLSSSEVGLLYGQVPPLDMGQRGAVKDVADADCIILAGDDPLDGQKVIGYLTKRAIDKDATLIVVSDVETGLDPRARERVPLAEAGRVAAAVEKAARPVVLYGAGMPQSLYTTLKALPEKTKFIPLVDGTNAAGAAQIGLRARPVSGQALYVLAADEIKDGHALPEAQFTVVQAAYWTPTAEKADVVLPSLDWTEQQGHVINTEGNSLAVVPFLKPPENVQADVITLGMLASRLRA
jgi:predicted molibdopterin-dependent oxidoreductase YjgC